MGVHAAHKLADVVRNTCEYRDRGACAAQGLDLLDATAGRGEERDASCGSAPRALTTIAPCPATSRRWRTRSSGRFSSPPYEYGCRSSREARAHGERRAPRGRCPAERDAPLGPSGRPRSHRDAVRLRSRPMRCVLRHRGRPGGRILSPHRRSGRAYGDHDGRGACEGDATTSGATGVHRLRWSSMRHLHAGHGDSATALLRRDPKPDETSIRDALAGNLCRCGVYGRAIRAVQKAASPS